jgi:DNA-binding NtrC family response regulator
MANAKVLPFTRKHRVLLIEDDDQVRSGLALALMSNGFVVHAVTTAEEAIKLVSHKLFHSIICDYNLPGMSGLEFFIKMKAFTARSTNVLITAYGFDHIYNSAATAGIDAFFEKPFTIHALISSLNAGSKSPDNRRHNGANLSGPSIS